MQLTEEARSRVVEASKEIRKMASQKLEERNITTELWREYDFGGRVYRIETPATLFYRIGGTTHRIVDSLGIAHCIPAPGINGCVLRWKNKDDTKPVNF
jgi:hypothetical protein